MEYGVMGLWGYGDVQFAKGGQHELAFGDAGVGEGETLVTVAHPVVVENVKIDGAGVIDGAAVLRHRALLGTAQPPLDALQRIQKRQGIKLRLHHDDPIEEGIRLEPPGRGLDDRRTAHDASDLPTDEKISQLKVEGTDAYIAA